MKLQIPLLPAQPCWLMGLGKGDAPRVYVLCNCLFELMSEFSLYGFIYIYKMRVRFLWQAYWKTNSKISHLWIVPSEVLRVAGRIKKPRSICAALGSTAADTEMPLPGHYVLKSCILGWGSTPGSIPKRNVSFLKGFRSIHLESLVFPNEVYLIKSLTGHYVGWLVTGYKWGPLLFP